MHIQTILKEGPYDSPNKKHVKLIKDKKFLKMIRHEIMARLFNALTEFFKNDKEYCKQLQKCLDDYAESIKVIGGFLTKFAEKDSDIDVNVFLQKEMLNRISPDHEVAIEEIMDFFREKVNEKPVGKGYDYVINYFFLVEEPKNFKRHGIELFGDEIKKKEVQDELDKKMVDVTDYLPKESFEKYIFKPMKKAIKIIDDMIDRKEFDRCDELKKVYDITERVGSDVWKEFKGFPSDLTIYHYTADNLRYKAMNEKSDFKKFMVYCQHDKLDKLKNFMVKKNWKIDLDFEKCLNPQIVRKVIKENINESSITMIRKGPYREHTVSIENMADFLHDISKIKKLYANGKVQITDAGKIKHYVDISDLYKPSYLKNLFYKLKNEGDQEAKIKKATNAYRITHAPFSSTNGANDYNRY